MFIYRVKKNNLMYGELILFKNIKVDFWFIIIIGGYQLCYGILLNNKSKIILISILIELIYICVLVIDIVCML